METGPPPGDRPAIGLSSEKREDIWALLIAAVVLLISLWTPAGVHNLFKKVLLIF